MLKTERIYPNLTYSWDDNITSDLNDFFPYSWPNYTSQSFKPDRKIKSSANAESFTLQGLPHNIYVATPFNIVEFWYKNAYLDDMKDMELYIRLNSQKHSYYVNNISVYNETNKKNGLLFAICQKNEENINKFKKIYDNCLDMQKNNQSTSLALTANGIHEILQIDNAYFTNYQFDKDENSVISCNEMLFIMSFSTTI